MNKKIFIIIAIVGVIAGTVLGLKKSAPADTAIPLPAASSAEIKNLADANNRFGFDLYAKLKSEQGNIFFSPYSISTALGMVYEGARAGTADEIRSVFGFPADAEARRAGFKSIQDGLNAKNVNYTLSVANALWAQNDYTFLPEYLTAVATYYDGKASNVDFKNAAEQARQTINAWVEGKTNNKIKNLFPSNSLDSSTRLVLTNAVYFKGQWVKQFNAKNTHDQIFYLDAAKTTAVSMMSRTDEKAVYGYGENEQMQILEMPYEGDKLSMLILLPKERDGISGLEQSLSVSNLAAWKKNLKTQRVYTYIPKFTFSTGYGLNDTLSDMGMPTAFTGSADFSGMDGTRNLSIQTVVHKAFVDVNEEGTEAAAATGVGMTLTSVPTGPAIPTFSADHPFIFLVQDTTSGNILFIGRFSHPKSGQ